MEALRPLMILLVFGAWCATGDVAMETDILRQLAELRREMADMKHNYEMRISVLEETVAGKCTTDNKAPAGTDGTVTYNTTELEERVEVLEMTVLELDEDIDNINADINILQADVSDIDADIENIELRMDAEEDTSETHGAQIAALQLAYETLTERLGNVEETQNVTYLELNERLTTVETSTSQHQADITQLYDVTNSLERDIQGLANFSFLATMSELTVDVVDGQILIFDEVRINNGANYNPSSGEYTVPVDGLYQLTVNVLSNFQAHGGCYLQVDGNNVAFSRQRDEVAYDSPFTLTVLLELTTGQVVVVQNYIQTSVHGSGGNGAMYTWFTGYLVKAG